MAKIIGEARQRFEKAELPEAGADARVLIGGLLGLSTTELLTQSDRKVQGSDLERIESAIERRLNHEPVYRILGQREFYGLDFELSAATLEPRPDTEILVDITLFRLRRIVASKGTARILDLGTGTGAIALALLKECSEAEAVLCDLSTDALIIATRNAQRNQLSDRAKMVESNWYQAVAGQFDIIVSNPPYIVSDVIACLAPEVRGFDPLSALDGGVDGLDAYRAIASGAAPHLIDGGSIAVEIGYDQKESVSAIFTSAGYVLCEAAQDYGGNDRVLVFVCAAAV